MKNDLAIRRRRRGLTQEELAEAVGVTRQTIIGIERNRHSPSLELAFELAAFFDSRVEDLFFPESATAYTRLGY